MERATPVQMRQALEAVDALKRAGVRFVPIPVLNDQDHESMVKMLSERLDVFEAMAADGEA